MQQHLQINQEHRIKDRYPHIRVYSNLRYGFMPWNQIPEGRSRVLWDGSGPRRTNRGPRDTDRAGSPQDETVSRKTNQSPAGTDQGPADESGTTRGTNQDSRSRKTNQGPVGRMRAPRNNSGPRGTNHEPRSTNNVEPQASLGRMYSALRDRLGP